MRGIFAHGRQFTSVLLILISATIVSIGGCAGTPITAHPTEEFVDTDAARALLGMPESDVYKRFGEPHWKLDVVDNTYLIYAAGGKVDLMWELFLPFMVLPAEAYSDGGVATLYCAVFEIDKAGTVTQFDSDWSRFYATSRYGKLHTCMRLIPRDALIAERDRLRIKVATEGDNNAYHKLEHIFLDNQGRSLDIFRREYLRKRLKEGDDSRELKMELVRLGELDPFGVLQQTKAGQRDAVELDLCAGGRIASIEIDRISEDGTRLPIYHL